MAYNGIQQLYDAFMARYEQEARSYVDAFWTFKKSENSEREPSDRSTLGCRVRRTNNTVRILWFYSKPYMRRSAESPTYMYHIRKRTNRHRYPDYVLRRYAKDWELEMVRHTEDQLAHIREKIAHLVQLRRYAAKIESAEGLVFVLAAYAPEELDKPTRARSGVMMRPLIRAISQLLCP